MKLRRSLVAHFHLHLLLPLALLCLNNASSANTDVNVTLPGCDCPVSSCLTHETDTAWMTNPFPCSFYANDNANDNAIANDNDNVAADNMGMGNSSSICDAIDLDLDQSSNKEYRVRLMDEVSPSKSDEEHEHEYAHVAMFGGYGTCDDALSVQCHNVQSLDLRLSTMSVMDPLYCGGTFYPPPSSTLSSILTEAALSIYVTCRAHFTKDTEGNTLKVFIEVGDENATDTNICQEGVDTPPVLTDDDWIESDLDVDIGVDVDMDVDVHQHNNKGRRYMCHNFTTPAGDDFFVLFLNIGNKPCKAEKDVPLWRKFTTPHRIIFAIVTIAGIVAVNVYDSKVLQRMTLDRT